MRQIELLAPARDLQIGIAAIDCGADAVYIAGEQFGARQAAGNSMSDIQKLCSHAHKFGARIFVTMNTIIYDSELEQARRQMMEIQEAGADAIIVQDLAILELARQGGLDGTGFRLPLHASTQCAIRTPDQAVFLESLGFSRLILERELSLEEIKAIRKAVSCELEFFVHGALCVCYSGQCYLSENISGRSANRGSCIQACRSRYDLTDASGRILAKDKALLSLKDYNLRDRLEELAEAGITSFKIEGRLKNASYVKNVVRDYSIAIDSLIRNHPEYLRASFGHVSGGFTPDTGKTFNRGYTQLFLDGKRSGQWSCMDTAKSMGEEIGTITSLSRDKSRIIIRPVSNKVVLSNGDGFSFVSGSGTVTGFRGDVCEGMSIRCKSTPELFVGARLFRNISAAFEKEIERSSCTRMIDVNTHIHFSRNDGIWTVEATAVTEDGREAPATFLASDQNAGNPEKMLTMLKNQICKSTGNFRFGMDASEESAINCGHESPVPFMTASFMNSIRRGLAEKLETMPCIGRELMYRAPQPDSGKPFPNEDASYKCNISNRLSREIYALSGAKTIDKAYELSHKGDAELMRTKYCIRHEIGICPRHHRAKDSGPLFLINNGRRLALHFDCRKCEMTVSEVTPDIPRPQK